MPIFEYFCRRCDTKIEIIQRSVSDSVTCPQCGQSAELTVSTFASARSSCAQDGGGCAPSGGFG